MSGHRRDAPIVHVDFRIAIDGRVCDLTTAMHVDATVQDLVDFVAVYIFRRRGAPVHGLYNAVTGVKYHNNASLDLITQDALVRLFVALSADEGDRIRVHKERGVSM
jgi:hypothetical protein